MDTPEVSPEAVKSAVKLLETLVGNRLLLAEIEPESRKALLMAAGRVSRPERLELIRVTREYRRQLKKKEKKEDRVARARAGIRQARTQTVFLPPAREIPAQETSGKLNNPRQCYVCKVRFEEVHHFYDTMCKACGDLNYDKRFQTANLQGRVALVTGSRLKIGYQCALKLLQAGARVIMTTRFPRDAALRLEREPDFSVWRDRVHVHGLDLRHSPSVELFCDLVARKYDRLDYLINNAAQTVRRPPAFYSHLMEQELAPYESLSEGARQVLADHEAQRAVLADHSTRAKLVPAQGNWLEILQDPRPGIGIRQSAALSQIPYHFEDLRNDPEIFPEGRLDADLQQVDLRKRNTWRLKLGEITTPEMLEVHLINSVAPFILCGRLRELMTRDFTGEKHMVNVSAMEGKFNRHTKTDKHPHTNMAKAALNMLTLTSAPDLAEQGIYMNAVDTGWVTDEDPIHHSLAKQAEHDFHPPLDIVDGAARVLDPIFVQKLTGQVVWGKFLKDYGLSDW